MLKKISSYRIHDNPLLVLNFKKIGTWRRKNINKEVLLLILLYVILIRKFTDNNKVNFY